MDHCPQFFVARLSTALTMAGPFYVYVLATEAVVVTSLDEQDWIDSLTWNIEDVTIVLRRAIVTL
jgi:hypothetical protein